MDRFNFDFAEAAQWIWDNRNGPQYWEWTDFTEENPDKSSLNLSKAVAWNICTVLESKGLVHSMEPFEKKSKIISRAFKIDLSDSHAWKLARRPPTCFNRIRSFFGTLWRSFYLFLFGLLSVAITSICVYGIERWIDITWPIPK